MCDIDNVYISLFAKVRKDNWECISCLVKTPHERATLSLALSLGQITTLRVSYPIEKSGKDDVFQRTRAWVFVLYLYIVWSRRSLCSRATRISIFKTSLRIVYKHTQICHSWQSAIYQCERDQHGTHNVLSPRSKPLSYTFTHVRHS